MQSAAVTVIVVLQLVSKLWALLGCKACPWTGLSFRSALFHSCMQVQYVCLCTYKQLDSLN